MEFGLIGKTLLHSFSAGYFTTKFQANGLDNCTYSNFELASVSEFPQLLSDHPALLGVNVTIPYKQDIISYLDEIDPVARDLGAVNVIDIRSGKLTGYNTDVLGFQLSLKQALPQLAIPIAYILGSGGASKAVQYVLAKADIDYRLVSRSPAANQMSYSALNAQQAHDCLIVNTTPLGTFPNINEMPEVSLEILSANSAVIDLIYNPSLTTLLRKAQLKGCRVVNGLSMLHGQAEASWQIWNKGNSTTT